MSDIVAVMDQGCIVQEAPPMEIYQSPRERFVANFIGLTNFLEGRVKKVGRPGEVETPSGSLKCILPEGAAPGEGVVIVIRPEDVKLAIGPFAQEENVLEGKVEAVIFMGDTLECQVTVGAKRMRIKLHPSSLVERGQTIRLELPAERCRALKN